MRKSTKAVLTVLYFFFLGYAMLGYLSVKAFFSYLFTVYLYLMVGITLLGLVQTVVITPLDQALSEDERVPEPDPAPARRPHDEESLIHSPDSDPDDTEPFCEQIFVLRAILLSLVAASLFVTAAAVRPARTGVLLGAYQVLTRVVVRTAAVLLGPALVIFAPIIILWIKVTQIGDEHKSLWYNFTICRRIIIAVFVYLLAVEGILLFRPPATETVLAHLAWQASLLSPFFDWLGCSAYPLTLLCFFTDQVGVYFLHRGKKYLRDHGLVKAAKPTTAVGHGSKIHPVVDLVASFIVPLAMICNGYVNNTPSIQEGLTSTALLIVLNTVTILSIFLFDLALYWTYYYCISRRSAEEDRSSPADVMAISMVAFAVRDTRTGQPVWKTFSKWNKRWEEQEADSSQSDHKLAVNAEEQAETEKSADSQGVVD
ncbi:hypothetical protein C8F04DRAFT_1151782 [Mycena alexandri]|uniref:Uncharacterized protein n=1 Tax=Mycena alexandri TaxID=1745969 RepID=A0AAD6WLD2_9AGAR|nr:hypothetical protein C8F04DRAFT_1151782 [Mycena alexandri]